MRFLKPGMKHLTGRVLSYDRTHDRYNVLYTEVHLRARATTVHEIVEPFAPEELVAFQAVSR